MTRRKSAEPEAGIRAMWDGICPKCGGDIERGVDRVYAKRGEWFHIGCASGADDR